MLHLRVPRDRFEGLVTGDTLGYDRADAIVDVTAYPNMNILLTVDVRYASYGTDPALQVSLADHQPRTHIIDTILLEIGCVHPAPLAIPFVADQLEVLHFIAVGLVECEVPLERPDILVIINWVLVESLDLDPAGDHSK